MKRKQIIGIIVVILTCLIVGISVFYVQKQQKIQIEKQRKIEKEKQEKKLVKDIESHYHPIVKVSKDTKLYQKNNKDYQEIGTVKEDMSFQLEEINTITSDMTYFKIKDMPYYLSYDAVEKMEQLTTNERYKNYIPFSLEITTKDSCEFYDEKEKELFTLNEPTTFQVIEKKENYIGVEMFHRLVYLKNTSIQSEKELDQNLEKATSMVAILYHFIYLNGDTSCNELICHSEEQIKQHFNYIKEQGYFTATTDEVYKFIKGQINLPKKSMIITIDDGARAENFIPFLEQYQLNATLFLVSSWYPKDKFASSYLEVASHTHDMHTTGVCPQGQGGGLNCLPREKILADLKASRETLDGTTAMAYPFFEFNETAVNLVGEAGFHIAFIGGQRKITPGINSLKTPRYTMHSDTSVESLARMITP